MAKILFRTFILIVSFSKVHAQIFDQTRFVHYTTVNGLSDNFITSLAQDNYGYVWIATTNGLNRFDGKEIKHFYQTPGKADLLSDEVRGVTSAGNQLLLYTSRGTQWMDVAKQKFTSLIVEGNEKSAPFRNDVYEASFTDDGVCFETTYTGAYAFDRSGRLRFRYDTKQDRDKGGRYGLAAVRLNRHQILHFDGHYNLSIYDSRRNSFLPIDNYKTSLPGLYSLKGNLLMLRSRLSKNKILFCTAPSRQMVIYDVEKDEVKWQPPPPPSFRDKIQWQSRWLTINDSTAILYGGVTGLRFVHINPASLKFTYSTKVLFQNQTCTAAFLDKDNRVWIGTQNGLHVQNIKEPGLRPIHIPLPNNHPVSIPVSFNSFLRRGNLLYVGNYHFLPLAVLDAETYKLKRLISFEKLSPQCNQIWSILDYNKDTIWLATQNGLVWYNDQSGRFGRVVIPAIDTLLRGHSISLLFKDREGLIWIQAYWGSGVIRYNPATKEVRRFTNEDQKNFLPLRVVNFVAEDGEHNIWFGENGLIRWNRKKDAFDTLIQTYFGFNKDNAKIFSLSSDKSGNLIFSNQNNGVLLYQPKTKKYQQISTVRGLPENAIYFAKSNPNNCLWIVSHNYITAINNENGKTISYSYADSLPPSLFNYAWHDSVSHRMLFGFDNEVLWSDDSITSKPKHHTPFYIDALHIADDTTLVFPSRKIELKHWQNDITIHYSALNFEDPQANRFAFRINKEGWKSLGNETTLRFSSLSDGAYNLEIRYYSSSNSDAEATQKLQFVIHPPFWKTTLFYLLIAILVLTILLLFYRNRIKQIRQKAAVEKQLAEFEIKALHAQMNPHFVFNCLNSIREMILSEENRSASRYLSKFAHLMRLTLNQSSKPFISLHDTIDYLRRYVEMEQIRSSHFTYSIQAEKGIEAKDIFVPPMLIQPFIENAIWHGPAGQKEPIEISIRFLQKEEQLLCLIEDNGVGVKASMNQKQEKALDHQSMGIANVKQRIQVLNEKYNLQSTLTIEDKSLLPSYNQTGTLVTIRLLIKNNA